jgi:hypothetical protein
MIIDVQVWHWESTGMRPGSRDGNSYVEVREAELLLEEAHRRGFEQGKNDYDQREI